MKSLARSYVWWPRVDKDIERTVQTCSPCQQNRHDPPRENLNRWPEAEAPWSRIHVDFFGPFQGEMFFIVVDAFSKWVEVNIVPTVAVKIPKVEIPIGQNPGSRNPERSKSRTGQNPEGSKSRMGQNPEGSKSRIGRKCTVKLQLCIDI
ncbi:hypothetical protein M514_21411 [Trichuris suis]|uniref:RNA-directed DNA polymerase n=1 Tax=Trichuris suis TaxID=68888 RepID=A0A085NA85_9BILA|nr:hypothetical protein M514_21411 [Trichuris suis]